LASEGKGGNEAGQGVSLVPREEEKRRSWERVWVGGRAILMNVIACSVTLRQAIFTHALRVPVHKAQGRIALCLQFD